MRKLFILLLFFAFIIIGMVTLYHTVILSSKQLEVSPIALEEMNESALLRLSKGLQIPNSQEDSIGRQRIYRWLEDSYPSMHQHAGIQWQQFTAQSRLYKWTGRNERLRPLLFLFTAGVQEPALEEVPRWTYNPFLGKITGTEIWGCGTRSGKAAATAFMEAIEYWSTQEHIPSRTIYWAWLQQDKNDSLHPAQHIAKALKISNVRPECIINCASVIADSLLMDIVHPVALVGIAEAQELPMRLIATGTTPEKRMGDILEDWRLNPIPAAFDAPKAQPFWDFLVPEMPFGRRWIFANRNGIGFHAWAKYIANQDVITTELLNNTMDVRQLLTNAQGQTVSEVTWRVQPDCTPQDVQVWLGAHQHDSVRVDMLGSLNPYIPVAPTESYTFNVVQTTFRQVIPNILVVPSVLPEASAARHFHFLEIPIYHLSPLRYKWSDYENASTIDERIPVSGYYDMLHFYRQLVGNISK